MLSKKSIIPFSGPLPSSATLLVLAPHFHPRERFTEISRENPFHPQPPAGTPINLVSTKQLTGCQKRKSDPRGYQMNTLLEL